MKNLKLYLSVILFLTLFSSTSLKSQITFQQAAELVLELVILPDGDTSIVAYGYPNLLQPGDEVRSAEEEESIKVLSEPFWFFWIDEEKFAHFRHPTRFVYVHQETAEVFVEHWNWWPAINGEEIWDSSLDRSLSTDVIWGVPPNEPILIDTNPSGNIQGGDNSYSKVCLYIISGVDDAKNKWAEADKKNVEKAMKQYFGENNIGQTLNRNNPTMAQICQDLENMEGMESDKLVFYFTGHSEAAFLELRAHPLGSEDRKLTGAKLAGKLDDFDIPVWVMLDGCEAAGLVPALQAANIEGHAVVSAEVGKCGYAHPTKGSYWTTFFTECLNNDAADGNDAGTDVSPAEAQAWAENRLDNSGDDDLAGQNSSITPLTSTTTAVFDLSDTPVNRHLIQNYPNPFYLHTTFRFSLPRPGQVNLSLYNVMGEQVTTLLNARLAQGDYEVPWQEQLSLPEGVYLCKLEVEGRSEFIKILKQY